ncbi:MAG: hypothetical protein A4E69_01775 [Syntrophus sp. PtaB.Bin138]|nr:MAG: hypothetical protein A4E69_01775 [Syntrophus sp. PtaB.Bin138]
MMQRGFQGVGQPALDAVLDHQPVHHDVDVVFLLLVQFDIVGQVAGLAVDDHPHEALLAEIGQFLPVFAFAAPDDGREEADLRSLREGHDLIHHLGDGLGGDLPAATVAEGAADAGEEEAQVVIDLGHGADRGAGIPAGGLLFDGDGRGESLDGLHVRLFHLLQKLAGVGGQGFHVAPLSLGIDGVEGEGGFARTGDAGDDHQPVAGYLNVDALQVMLSGALDDYGVMCHGLFRFPVVFIQRPAGFENPAGLEGACGGNSAAGWAPADSPEMWRALTLPRPAVLLF